MPNNPSTAKKHAEIESISIAGISARMGPISLLVYARHYAATAGAVPIEPEQKFNPAQDYLVCHAVELALKAFLSLKGQTMLALAHPNFGHDLSALLGEAERQGLDEMVTLTEGMKGAIHHASSYHSGKVLQYPAVLEAAKAYPSLPDTKTLSVVASRLIAALYQPCLEA